MIGNVKAKSDDAFRRLLVQFLSFAGEALVSPHWGEQVSVRPDNQLQFSMVSQGVSAAEAAQVWRPFREWVAASPQDFSAAGPLNIGLPARGWWDADAQRKRGSMTADNRPGAPATHAWWTGDGDQVGVFWHGYDSVWLPASLLAEKGRTRLAEALYQASRHEAVGLHFNKGLAGAPPGAIEASRDTATNPAVLDAFALAIVAAGGRPAYPGLPGPAPDLALAHRNAAAVAAAGAALPRRGRDLAPMSRKATISTPTGDKPIGVRTIRSCAR